jgi:hypothetical protein
MVRYSQANDTSLGLTTAVNHLISTSSIIPAGTFTFEAWIRPTGNFATGPAVFSQGGTNGVARIRIDTNGEFIVSWGGNNDDTIENYQVPLDEWTHIALTKDGSNVPKFYVNGTQIWTGGANSNGYPGTFKLGEWYNNSNNDFVGEIDQVKIWSTALDAQNLAKSMHTYSSSGVSVTLNAD